MRFKMKQVGLAVGAVLGGLSMLPTAQAVHVSPDGLGQVLIFPYYTTRANWNTLINITNTSAETVVAKVRFHEGYNSRDVFDFTVILSPFDVWNGTLTNGAGNVPNFSTVDRSCTVPAIPAGGQSLAAGQISYTGAGAADSGPTGTERLREGYITVLMEGTVAPAFTPAGAPDNLAAFATHNPATRIPFGCNRLQQAFSLQAPGAITPTPYPIATLRADFPNYALNPLKGAFSLVNADNGWNASGTAVTLANFSTVNLITAQLGVAAVGGVYADSYHQPELSSSNTTGAFINNAGVVPAGPVGGADAVTFALNRASVINQWARLAASATNPWTVASDWVVTFPTKRFYVDQGQALPAPGNLNNQYSGRAAGRPGLPAPGVLVAAAPPFTSLFAGGLSCDQVRWTIFDREEQFVPGSPVFSPAPAGNGLCAETNVVTFDSSNVLGSAAGLTVNVPQLVDNQGREMQNGWMQMGFQNAGGRLPAVGFAVINRTEPAGDLNESFIVDHAYTR